MSKYLILQVTIIEEGTGEVVKQIIEPCQTNYGYEVTRLFDRVGEAMAHLIDNTYRS